MAPRAAVQARSRRGQDNRDQARSRSGQAALGIIDARRLMAERWSAPAKLNLYLHVVGRRADGYHVLDSLVAFAEPADEVIAEPAPALSLTMRSPRPAPLGTTARHKLDFTASQTL